MVSVFIFILGALLGGIFTAVFMIVKTGHGEFSVNPIDGEDDFYTIRVRLDNDEKLPKCQRIVLFRTSSQK